MPFPRFSLFVTSDIMVVARVTEPFKRPPTTRDIRNKVKVFDCHHIKYDVNVPIYYKKTITWFLKMLPANVIHIIIII